MEGANRAAEAIIAALSVQSGSGANRASASVERSSEFAATPPTTASARSPVSAAAARSRPTRARTIARWYEAARSARRCVELGRGEVAHRVQERGLEAGEREVEAGDARDRERERRRVAVPREPVDLGAAGIAEPEQPRALVECLPGRVVERRAEHVEPRPVAHREKQRVPAAREQARERRVERVGREVQRRDVAAEVVDRDEREAPRPGERLRSGQPDEQRADEAWALRDADAAARRRARSTRPRAPP